MGFDLTKWGMNEILEDFLNKPIKVTIENVSDKFIIKGMLQVFKKESGKDGKKHISKTGRQNTKNAHTRMAKMDSKLHR